MAAEYVNSIQPQSLLIKLRRIMKIFLTFLGLLTLHNYTLAVYGRLQYIVPVSATIQQYNIAYYNSVIQDYVSGGNTFTFPTGIFTLAPTVRVSTVLKNSVYSPTEMYVPVIVSINSTSATIRVNKISDGGGVVEAGTDDVSLHLLAVGV